MNTYSFGPRFVLFAYRYVFLFVVIGVIDPFHEQFTVIHFISQGIFQKLFDRRMVRHALLHRSQITVFVDEAPVRTALEILPEHQIQPDSHTSAISFHKWMGNVYLDVFINDLVKGAFGHISNFIQRLGQEPNIRKLKSSPGNVMPADLSGKII